MITTRAPAPLNMLDLSSLVWSSRLVVVVADARGTVVDTNETFARLAGVHGVGRPVADLIDGQELAFERWLGGIGSSWSRATWGLFPDADGVPRDFVISACRTVDDTLVLIGEALETDDISAALLDVNETLVLEHRRLERERGRLNRAIGLDALTGLANRRAFDQRLAYEVQRTAAGGTFAVVMIDIDHFKAVNDRFGHPTGDNVLQALGRVLETAARIGDFVARYGGEEFVAILPEATASNAVTWAERLRQVIRAERAPELDIPLTASLGVAAWRPGDTGQDVVDRADRALYIAKEGGRDRVAVDEHSQAVQLES